MNNLLRYLIKTISTACLWVVIFTVVLSSAYAFDNDRLDLTITRFLDSLSYNYRGFDIKVTEVAVGETFDDNVAFTEENKLEDFITELRLGLGIKYAGKTRTLQLDSKIISNTFAKSDVFNNVSQLVNLNFTNEFSKYDRISLTNVFRHSEAPIFSEEDYFKEQFERPSGRFDYFTNRFYINYSRDVAKQLIVSVRYNNDVDAFSGVDTPFSFLNKAGFKTDYLLTSATIFSFSYDFANRQFEDGANTSIHTIAPGIRQYITKKFYFDGRAGLDFIDSFDDKNFSKPLALASLTYQKDTDTIASLSFERRNDSTPYSADIFSNWRTTASLTRQMLERFRTSLSIFYGEAEFVSSNSKHTLLGANTTFIYDINKNLKGNLTYTYSQFEPETGSGGYTKNIVFLGLVAEF